MKLNKTLVTASTFLLIGIIVTSIVWVYASPSASTIWITEGIYPSGVSYTIWKEGSTYFAKNGYGQTPSWGSGTNISLITINAVSGSYKTLFFKSGEYYFDTVVTIPSFTKIFAEEFTRFRSTGSDMFMFDIVDAVSVEMSGFDINNDNNNTGIGINIWNSDMISIHDINYDGYANSNETTSKNVFIEINSASGITCDYIDIYNVYVQEGGNYGRLYGAIHVYQRARTLKIHDSNFINMFGGSIVVGEDCRNVQIDNNYFYISAQYVDAIDIVNASDVTISNNIVLWQGAIGIAIEEISANQYDNNILVNNNIVAYSNGGGITIGVGNSVYNVLVDGNIVYNNGKANPANDWEASGIILYDAFNCTITDNRVYDDQITASQKWGIYELMPSDYNYMVGNIAHGSIGGIWKNGTNSEVHSCFNGTQDGWIT